MNREDGLTREDWARYGGYEYSFSNARGEELGDDKGKEEEEYKNDFKKPFSNSVLQKKRKDDFDDPVVRQINREPENVERLVKLAGGSSSVGIRNTPIAEIDMSQPVIPYEIQKSAFLLMRADENGDIRLNQEALQNIKRLSECINEYTEVDPRVVIYDTFVTESGFKIYLKEAVPISILLLARYFGLEYAFESESRSFKDVKVKPFHGSLLNHVQDLGCEKGVKLRMQSDDPKWYAVRLYMLRVGPQSSENIVGDYDWFEAQTRAIGLILQKKEGF
jgi:hypothetical protein